MDKKAIFKLYSLGVVTNRDEWVFSYDIIELQDKVNYFIKIYNNELLKQKGKIKQILKRP
ncbi:MAG: hypothetical protein IPL12_09465 [Bacteroidetes bacterium]|nr:hypothetical protein [Bacteroidota bacterium]